MAYYFDNMDEIRQQIKEGEAFALEMKAKTPSLVQQKLRERYVAND